MIYLLIAALVALAVYLIFFKNSNSNSTVEKNNSRSGSGTKLDHNPFLEMRELAYTTDYNQLQLPDPGNKEILYGVIMDWDYDGKAIITLVSFISGDASLYFSTGAAIIGAGQHPEVSQVAKAFIEKAQSLLPDANEPDTSLTIEKGFLKFYLMTNRRKYVIKEKLENVRNETSKLAVMLEEANKVIAYIRMTQEKMQRRNVK